MRLLWLAHLLLGLALLAWTGVDAASLECEKTCKPQAQKGFHRERPECECGSGYYRSCTDGAYYAHTPSMCIYVSRQEFTHEEAQNFCATRFKNSGFLAFVEDWDESYHIAHYVWNDLKQGVEGDETYYWLGGKFSTSTRTNEAFLLYEYGNNYFAEVPDALFPKGSTRTDAYRDWRDCIAGHTKDYDKLYAKDCTEKLPAVCYYYRETAGWYCEPVEGMVATLFRKKCYYQYSAPLPFEDNAGKEIADNLIYYKTWFEAREECAKIGAKLASIHDEDTHEKLVQLSTGKETKFVEHFIDSTWIGLQKGCKAGVDERNASICSLSSGCYWKIGERARMSWDAPGSIVDPDPNNAVLRCSTTYNNTFLGQWEDGQLYNHTESEKFWADGEPNDEAYHGCEMPTIDQNKAYCLRGYRNKEGKPDNTEHCAQIFPSNELFAVNMAYFAGKWNDYWCFRPNRGYVCERPALPSTTGSKNDEL